MKKNIFIVAALFVAGTTVNSCQKKEVQVIKEEKSVKELNTYNIDDTSEKGVYRKVTTFVDEAVAYKHNLAYRSEGISDMTIDEANWLVEAGLNYSNGDASIEIENITTEKTTFTIEAELIDGEYIIASEDVLAFYNQLDVEMAKHVTTMETADEEEKTVIASDLEILELTANRGSRVTYTVSLTTYSSSSVFEVVQLECTTSDYHNWADYGGCYGGDPIISAHKEVRNKANRCKFVVSGIRTNINTILFNIDHPGYSTLVDPNGTPNPQNDFYVFSSRGDTPDFSTCVNIEMMNYYIGGVQKLANIIRPSNTNDYFISDSYGNQNLCTQACWNIWTDFEFTYFQTIAVPQNS